MSQSFRLEMSGYKKILFGDTSDFFLKLQHFQKFVAISRKDLSSPEFCILFLAVLVTYRQNLSTVPYLDFNLKLVRENCFSDNQSYILGHFKRNTDIMVSIFITSLTEDTRYFIHLYLYIRRSLLQFVT